MDRHPSSWKSSKVCHRGRVLGPVSFLLFFNDLPLHLCNSSVDIFADDTTLSLNAHYEDIAQLTNNLGSDLVVLINGQKKIKCS